MARREFGEGALHALVADGVGAARQRLRGGTAHGVAPGIVPGPCGGIEEVGRAPGVRTGAAAVVAARESMMPGRNGAPRARKVAA